MFKTVKIGPQSAGSDPGPACYDRGGLKPTVTDADLVLGYLDPANYANGHIKLNPRRSKQAFEELCDELDMEMLDVAKLIKQNVDANMANGIATELRTRGYEPKDFTVLAYGGNGPLHACGIAQVLGIDRILAPPFSSVFSAVGAGNMNQMHIHEISTWTTLFDPNVKVFFNNYAQFNGSVEELERRGREDLLRQGFTPDEIQYRLEIDMRYGNQRVQTAVVTDLTRLNSQSDVLRLIAEFHTRYGERFGEGSQSPEAGIRINTIRVCSFVEKPNATFSGIQDDGRKGLDGRADRQADVQLRRPRQTGRNAALRRQRTGRRHAHRRPGFGDDAGDHVPGRAGLALLRREPGRGVVHARRALKNTYEL
jgi:N-methylhydantoinase A